MPSYPYFSIHKHSAPYSLNDILVLISFSLNFFSFFFLVTTTLHSFFILPPLGGAKMERRKKKQLAGDEKYFKSVAVRLLERTKFNALPHSVREHTS
jgi:hypothetical protein